MAADLLTERLPPDWNYGVTGDGRVFFINERQRQTSWLHPVTGRPVQTGHQAAPGLPNGWEHDFTPEGVTYFIDHNSKQTTFSHPVTGRPLSEENPPPPPRSPPRSPVDRSELPNGKQRSIKTPSAKRNPSAQVVRQGFLYRLESGTISKTWKRRWCVLADFALFIYKSDDEKATLGSILLPGYRINRCSAQDPVQKEFAFKVEHENTKTEFFHTDTHTDLDSWLSNLQHAASMTGSNGFYRETNNNIKRNPAGAEQRSPPCTNQREDYTDSTDFVPPNSEPDFYLQWRNPNPGQPTLPEVGPRQQGLSGQPSWRSVPNLERDVQEPRAQQERYDPRGSLRSLPQDMQGNAGFPSSSLQRDLRSYPHHLSYDVRMGQERIDERDPRGSIRSLQADPQRSVKEFVPLSQLRGSERDNLPYLPESQRYQQQPGDSQQRLSMVSSSSQHGSRGSRQSPHHSFQDVNTSQTSLSGNLQPHSLSHNSLRNESNPTVRTQHAADQASVQNRNSWQGSNSELGSQPKRNFSREHLNPDRINPEMTPHSDSNREPMRTGQKFYPVPKPRSSTSRDPRYSYASSQPSVIGPGYSGARRKSDSLGSREKLIQQPGVRSSVFPPKPLPTAQQPVSQNAQAHIYMNISQVQNLGRDYNESLPPERPPYPAAVRDLMVHELAGTYSPHTAEKMLAAHEMNKERMQRLPYFQYPTPTGSNSSSRLDESHSSDPVKRLSQNSDYNPFTNPVPHSEAMNKTNRSQPGSSMDYPDRGRMQGSGSGHVSDSFERLPADGQRVNDQGKHLRGSQLNEADVPAEMRFGGDPEAKSLRQAYERVQSFRQSSAAVRDGMPRRPIQTVKEEPDMPDDEVLETKQKKKYPLNGTRLRMSISAGDLIGKTHDELVLLLIQLRRNQAALGKARDFYRESLSKRRQAEREYRKQRNESVGSLERSLEESHQSFVDIRSQLEEVEKKLEVYRPLINLVDNMVTMGSLYGGDNFMLATQYRKHLLRPDQYQAPRKMLEFSRKYQEERVGAGIENDVRLLTATEVDLEEKIDRLNYLERLLQEQSFKVSSFREDKELLEKALQGIQKQIREGRENHREMRKLQQQQLSVEKELSRVTQELAEASKALEETTVETNKIEHHVSLLRSKVHGELKRSKSAPSLGTETANAKVKMERELARVQDMLQGLSQQGEELSQQMRSLRRTSSEEAEKARKAGTYLQTDLDTGDQVDLAQEILARSALSDDLMMSGADTPVNHSRQESLLSTGSSVREEESRSDLDLQDADENTKIFYGLTPAEKTRGPTVRDVKRQLGQRRERKQDEGGQEVALKVSSTDDDTSTIIHARYPSYESQGILSRSPLVSAAPLYENLPRSGSMPALNQNDSSGSRRSSITLLAPRPFTPYQDRTAKPFRSELTLNTNANSSEPFTRPFTSEMALNSRWDGIKPSYASHRQAEDASSAFLNYEPSATGQVGMAATRPLQMDHSLDWNQQRPVVMQASALPTYSRLPQPFRRDASGLMSQSTPHLNTLQDSSQGKVSSSQPWSVKSDVQQDRWKSPRSKMQTMMSPTIHSSAGDLISNARVDNVPDVVKSSLSNVDQIDEETIDREILYFPKKVLIPERYDPEADAEHLTEAEKMERQEKSERIKRLLTNQSVLSLSQTDVNKPALPQLRSQVLREKQEREHFLMLNQELARQVTQQSRRAAAERRKTWSGGQIADIKAQYELEQAAIFDHLDSTSRLSRQANILL